MGLISVLLKSLNKKTDDLFSSVFLAEREGFPAGGG
jgi:hypothetical protein